MVSIYFAVGIFCGMGLLLNYIKLKQKLSPINFGLQYLLYAISRICPIFMLQELADSTFYCLLIDIVIFIGIYLCRHRFELGNKTQQPSILYIFNPLAILIIVSGYTIGMLITATLIAILLAVVYHNHNKFNLVKFYPYYVCLITSTFCIFIAYQHLNQNISQCFDNSGNIPMLLIIALAGTIFSICLAIVKLAGTPRIEAPQIGLKLHSVESPAPPPMRSLVGKDYIIIILITLFSAASLFFRLGSTKAPVTTYEMYPENNQNQIILDFGNEVSISEICIFLGNKENRLLSFSVLNEKTNEWEVFSSNYKVTSVFCWNEVPVNQKARVLGIVSMDSEAYINEIVVLDSSGNQIMPINYGVYSTLFDEQKFYPENNTYYSRTMFDEVYHARTAYEFINELPIYEVSHPPLGKSIISVGIELFGMTPFGWRFMCALLGSLMTPIVYLFIWRITLRRDVSLVAAVLLSTEFMHFTLSRIATIDVIVAFFVLLMFFFMYYYLDCLNREASLFKQIIYLALCGTATGCAIATKWTGFYAAAGIAIILFSHIISYSIKIGWNKKLRKYLISLLVICVACFIVLPAIIYCLSYLPFIKIYTDRNLPQMAIENSIVMLNYHTDTVFDHPYSSEWYTWLINYRPLLDSLTIIDDKVSTVATLGNPLIILGGLISLIHNFYLWICKKEFAAKFLVISYLSMLVPWLFVFRTVFIYQYFICVVILVLLIGNSINHINVKRKIKLSLITAASCGLFCLYYPVISGYPVSAVFVNQVLELFTSWVFA